MWPFSKKQKVFSDEISDKLAEQITQNKLEIADWWQDVSKRKCFTYICEVKPERILSVGQLQKGNLALDESFKHQIDRCFQLLIEECGVVEKNISGRKIIPKLLRHKKKVKGICKKISRSQDLNKGLINRANSSIKCSNEGLVPLAYVIHRDGGPNLLAGALKMASVSKNILKLPILEQVNFVCNNMIEAKDITPEHIAKLKDRLVLLIKEWQEQNILQRNEIFEQLQKYCDVIMVAIQNAFNETQINKPNR